MPISAYSAVMTDTLPDRLRKRLTAIGISPRKASLDAGLSTRFLNNIFDGKSVSPRSDSLAAIAKVLGTTEVWLMRGEGPEEILTSSSIGPSANLASPTVRQPKPNASFPPRYARFPDEGIPLMGQTSAGANGRFVMNGQASQMVFCPPDLEGVEGAYAVRVHGYSMEPKFEAGDTVWMNPHAPVRKGDYVVVQVQDRDDGEELSSYIKQFISRGSGRLKLKQFNPEEGETEDLEFPDDLVFSVHKIVFHALA